MSSPEIQATLATVDAVLADEPVGPAQEPVAALSRTLRELRPAPSPEFARSLDARAAAGFARPRRSRRRISPARAAGALRSRMLASGLAAGALAAAAIALAVVLSSGSAGRHAVVKDSGGAASSAGNGAAQAGSTFGTSTKAGASPKAAEAARSANSPAEPARQVERGSSLEVGVSADSMQSAAQRVFTLVSAFKGYVQQSNVNSGGANGNANFDIRVPSTDLAATIAALGHLGHVRSETDNTNDVTSRYDSLQGALAAARAQRAGLLKVLARGSEPEAGVFSRLHEVQARISSLEGQLRSVRQRVDYSSLALTLSAEAGAGAGAGSDELTPGGAAADAGHILDAALAVLVLAAAVALPVGAVVLCLWLAFGALRRRAREQALDAG
jgi:hypothetical protein